MLQRVHALLESCTSDLPMFPPTLLFNEGWLLRLVLDWFSTHPVPNHPLNFSEHARWFSEALLPSAFQARYRSDNLAEARTHADGIIGQFIIGKKGKTDLELLPGATQFVVLEAKMYSGLSSNVTNVKYFDQIARNVACIAEVLRRANKPPDTMSQLGLYVLVPKSRAAQGIFSEQTDIGVIKRKVMQRTQEYAGEKDKWYSEWFQPTANQIKLGVINWEDIIEVINRFDPSSVSSFPRFLQTMSGIQ